MTDPRRSHELILQIGADTKRDLVNALRQMALEIDMDQLTAGVSGGYSSGAIYAYQHDPAITHDAYFAALEQKLRDAGAR